MMNSYVGTFLRKHPHQVMRNYILHSNFWVKLTLLSLGRKLERCVNASILYIWQCWWVLSFVYKITECKRIIGHIIKELGYKRLYKRQFHLLTTVRNVIILSCSFYCKESKSDFKIELHMDSFLLALSASVTMSQFNILPYIQVIYLYIMTS